MILPWTVSRENPNGGSATMRLSTDGGRVRVTARPKSASISRKEAHLLQSVDSQQFPTSSATEWGPKGIRRRPQSANERSVVVPKKIALGTRPQSATQNLRKPAVGLRPQSATLKRSGDPTVKAPRPRSAGSHGFPRPASAASGRLDSLDETRTVTNTPKRSHPMSSTARPRSALAGARAAAADGTTVQRGRRPQSAAVLRPGNKHHPLSSSTPSSVHFEQANRPLDFSGLLGPSLGAPLTGSSGWSELDSELSRGNKYDDWHEDKSVPLPEPAIFISIRPGNGAEENSHASEENTEPDVTAGILEHPGDILPADKHQGSYDLVVCVCGHVNLRQDRAAHMKVCSVVTRAMGQSTRTRKRFKLRMREAQVVQEWQSACKIQSLFRGFIARDYVSLRRKLETVMSTKIQTTWRAKLARNRTQKLWKRHNDFKSRIQNRAALSIQTYVRCWSAIRRVHRRRRDQAALRIATWWRCRQQIRRYTARLKRSHNDATTIQRVWRGQLGRAKAGRLVILRNKSATRIQACWRRFVTERWFDNWRREKILAASILQRVIRGHQARELTYKMKKIWTAAVSTIQRGWRGAKNRRLACKLISWRGDNVRKIQKVWRGHAGRRCSKRQRKKWNCAAVVIQSIGRMWLGKQRRIRKQQKAVARAERAATSIQKSYRGLLARRKVSTRRRKYTAAAQRIASWWRVVWAQETIRRFRDAVYKIQGWLRVILQKKRYITMKKESDTFIPNVLANDMADLELVSKCMHIFSKALSPKVEMVRTLTHILEAKLQLRWLYQKYSIDGVCIPERAFRMTKVQFLHMCKRMNVKRDMKPEQAAAFDKELPVVFDLANDDTVIVLREQLKAEEGEVEAEELEADKYLQLDEFYVAIVRMAIAFPEDISIIKKVRKLCQEFVIPYADKARGAELQCSEMEVLNLVPDLDATYQHYVPKLAKIFKQVAASGSLTKADRPAKKGKSSEAKEKERKSSEAKESDKGNVDATEFLQFCKIARIFDANFSMSAGLEAFVRCNQDEIQAFLMDPHPLHDLNQELKMEFKEFKEAFLLLAAIKVGKTPEGKRKKPDEVRKALNRFCEDSLEAAFKGYNHVMV